MKGLTTAFLMAFAWAAAGCTPESVNSLPDESRLPADERLIGTWRAEVMGNAHVAVVTAGAPGTLDVVLRSVTLDGAKRGLAPRETRHQLRFHELGGVPVIVERGRSLVERRTVHRFAGYRMGDDGSVTLLFLDQDPIWRVVAPLRLLGGMRNEDPVIRDILVDARGEDLAAAMARYTPDQLYRLEFGPFRRQ